MDLPTSRSTSGRSRRSAGPVRLRSRIGRQGTPAFNSTVFQRFVLRRSLDAISQSRDLLLTTDFVHQNGRGAALIAEVIDGSGLLTGSAG